MSAITMDWQQSGLTRIAEQSQAKAHTERKPGAIKRSLRRMFGVVALLFVLVGFTGGTAQAWSWGNPLDSIGSYVSNICQPLDVGKNMSTNDGIDNAFLPKTKNAGAKGETGTYVPADPGDGSSTKRLNAMYGNVPAHPGVTNPTFERYGFQSLKWTSYGASCYGMGFYSTWVLNPLFAMTTKFPVMVAMGVTNIALGSNLAEFALTLLQPIYSMFAAISKPWWAFLAFIGAGITYWKSKGSLQEMLKYFVFAFFCMGTILYIGEPSGKTFATGASNLVTKIVGGAACQMQGAPAGSTACSGEDHGMKGINNSLWKGLAYEPWAVGEVGQREAQLGAGNPKQPSWGPAMLNAMYVNPDDEAGKKLLGEIGQWDGGSYEEKGENGSKIKYWTDGFESSDDKAYDKHKTPAYSAIPFLQNIRALCNDTSKRGGQGSEEKFLYDGRCASDGRTASVVSALRGDDFDTRFLVSVTSGIGAFIVGFVIAVIATYVTILRFMFIYLLGFSALWLSIALIGDEKRKAFARKWGEMLFANLVKQGGAICVLLVISYTVSAIMVPPATEDSVVLYIPWIFKPWLMMVFVFALLLMIIPFMKLSKAIAKGDTSIVEKTGNAPTSAAKGVAKAAAVAGAVYATGGTAAVKGAASSMGRLAANAGKPGGLSAMAREVGQGNAAAGYRKMGQAVGTINKGAGRKLREAGHLAGIADTFANQENVRNAGAGMLMNSPMFPRLKGESDADYQKRAAAEFQNISAANQKRLSQAGVDKKAADALHRHSRIEGTAAALMKNDTTGKYAGPGGAELARSEAQAMLERQDLRSSNALPYFDAYNNAAEGKRHPQDPREIYDAANAQEKVITDRADALMAQDTTGRYDGRGGGALARQDAIADLAREGRVSNIAERVGARAETLMAADTTGQYDGPNGEMLARQHASEQIAREDAGNDGVVAKLPAVAPSAQQAAQAREMVASLVGTSPLTRSEDLAVIHGEKSADLLSAHSLTSEGVVRDPSVLLTAPNADGQLPYQGSVRNMDPSHPATAAMTQLAFAQEFGGDSEVAEAKKAASTLIASHGVPDAVFDMRSTGEAGQQFVPAQLLGAMPVMTAETSWQERAEAATTMSAAAATMPDWFPESTVQAVSGYSEALATPSASLGDVEALRMLAYSAVTEAVREATDDATGDLAAAMTSTASGVAAGSAAGAGAGAAATMSLFGDEPPVSSYEAAEYGVPVDAQSDYGPPSGPVQGTVPASYDAPDGYGTYDTYGAAGSQPSGMVAADVPSQDDGWTAQDVSQEGVAPSSLEAGVAPEQGAPVWVAPAPSAPSGDGMEAEAAAPQEEASSQRVAMGPSASEAYGPRGQDVVAPEAQVSGATLFTDNTAAGQNGTTQPSGSGFGIDASALLDGARRLVGGRGGSDDTDVDDSEAMSGDDAEFGAMSSEAQQRNEESLFGDDDEE